MFFRLISRKLLLFNLGIRHYLHVILEQIQSQKLAVHWWCGNSSRSLQGPKEEEKPHFLIHFQKRKKNSDVKSKPLFQYYYRCRKILGKYQGLKSGERV